MPLNAATMRTCVWHRCRWWLQHVRLSAACPAAPKECPGAWWRGYRTLCDAPCQRLDMQMAISVGSSSEIKVESAEQTQIRSARIISTAASDHSRHSTPAADHRQHCPPVPRPGLEPMHSCGCPADQSAGRGETAARRLPPSSLPGRKGQPCPPVSNECC